MADYSLWQYSNFNRVQTDSIKKYDLKYNRGESIGEKLSKLSYICINELFVFKSPSLCITKDCVGLILSNQQKIIRYHLPLLETVYFYFPKSCGKSFLKALTMWQHKHMEKICWKALSIQEKKIILFYKIIILYENDKLFYGLILENLILLMV